MDLLPNNIYHGECLELMRGIPDGSIDCVITDPPYGTTACKWDSVIPFEPMWEALERVVKPSAAIALFGSEPFSSALRMSNILLYKVSWVWAKGTIANFIQSANHPMRVTEDIMVFGKDRVSYYPVMEVKNREQIKKEIQRTGSKGKGSGVYGNNIKEVTRNAKYSYPQNIIYIPSNRGECNNLKRIHPTQKPVPLIEYLIRTYTLPGETVLDFTMGSGTACVAAIKQGRKYIGIEQEEKYFKIAQERIERENQQLKLF